MHRREYRLTIHQKVWVENARNFVVGDGGLALLRAIDVLGSVRAAAREVGWSYRHTLAYVTNAERALGRALVVRARGGNDRGGSALTPTGREFVRRYTRFRARLDHELEQLYREAFREPER